MGKRHWHVLAGLQGCYMPNTNYAHRTLKEAEADAAEQAETARDEGYKVTGSARSRWYEVGEHQCIEIVDCHEADCWCPSPDCEELATGACEGIPHVGPDGYCA